jgi:hypothetical protein
MKRVEVGEGTEDFISYKLLPEDVQFDGPVRVVVVTNLMEGDLIVPLAINKRVSNGDTTTEVMENISVEFDLGEGRMFLRGNTEHFGTIEFWKDKGLFTATSTSFSYELDVGDSFTTSIDIGTTGSTVVFEDALGHDEFVYTPEMLWGVDGMLVTDKKGVLTPHEQEIPGEKDLGSIDVYSASAEFRCVEGGAENVGSGVDKDEALRVRYHLDYKRINELGDEDSISNKARYDMTTYVSVRESHLCNREPEEFRMEVIDIDPSELNLPEEE